MSVESVNAATSCKMPFEERVLIVLGTAGIWLFISGLLWEYVMLQRFDFWMKSSAAREHSAVLSGLVHFPADLMMITGGAAIITSLFMHFIPLAFFRLWALANYLRSHPWGPEDKS